MGWLNDPEEAAKHPRRVLAVMLLSGLVVGSVIGYFRFDRSPSWAAILGVIFGAIFTYIEWKTLRDPPWVQRRNSPPEIRKALLGLAMPFLALAIAFIVGAVTQSVHVFIVVAAVGLSLGLALRFTMWR
jgi:hypothetical protein